MPKGYLIAHMQVYDAEKMQEFRKLSRPAIAKYNGRILASSPTPEFKEGPENGVAVIVEFDSLEAARTFYHSKEYTEARAIREQAAQTDLLLVEGE